MKPFRFFPLSTSLALLFTALPSVAQGVSVEEASPEQKASAQELFVAGDKSFDIQEYETALARFRESYDEVASPNSRLMVARSLLELGHLDEAYDEYNGVLADASESDKYGETRTTAERERDALKNRLAWLSIDLNELPETAVVKIAGRVRQLNVGDEGYGVTPGATIVVATTDEGILAEAIVHLAAGRRATARLKPGEKVVVGTPATKKPVAQESAAASPAPSPPPPPPPTHNMTPWVIAAGAVGILGMGAFGTFGFLSGRKHQSLQNDCDNGTCPPSSQDDIDSGKQMQLLANVGLGVGVAGLGTSVLLYLLDQKEEAPVNVRVGFYSVEVKGTF